MYHDRLQWLKRVEDFRTSRNPHTGDEVDRYEANGYLWCSVTYDQSLASEYVGSTASGVVATIRVRNTPSLKVRDRLVGEYTFRVDGIRPDGNDLVVEATGFDSVSMDDEGVS